MGQRRRQIRRERHDPGTRPQGDGRLVGGVVQGERRRPGPPGAAPAWPVRVQHGRGGQPEPFGQETVRDGRPVGESTQRDQRETHAVPTDVLQVLHPEVGGDPEFLTRDRDTPRRRRADHDPGSFELLPPGGIDHPGAGAGTTKESLDRVVVPAVGPQMEGRSGVRRPGRSQGERGVRRGFAEPGERR